MRYMEKELQNVSFGSQHGRQLYWQKYLEWQPCQLTKCNWLSFLTPSIILDGSTQTASVQDNAAAYCWGCQFFSWQQSYAFVWQILIQLMVLFLACRCSDRENFYWWFSVHHTACSMHHSPAPPQRLATLKSLIICQLCWFWVHLLLCRTSNTLTVITLSISEHVKHFTWMVYLKQPYKVRMIIPTLKLGIWGWNGVACSNTSFKGFNLYVTSTPEK